MSVSCEADSAGWKEPESRGRGAPLSSKGCLSILVICRGGSATLGLTRSVGREDVKDSATSYLDMVTSAIVEGFDTRHKLDGGTRASKCLAAPQPCCDGQFSSYLVTSSAYGQAGCKSRNVRVC